MTRTGGISTDTISWSQVFTSIRAVRIAARIALAVRILRAALKLARLYKVLGSGKPRQFVGHDRMVNDVELRPQASEAADQSGAWWGLWRRCGRSRPTDGEDASDRPRLKDKFRLLTASADTTVLMFDVLSDALFDRKSVAYRDDDAAPHAAVP